MNKFPLTITKNKWAKNRKTTLQGLDLNYNASLQNRYRKELLSLVSKMTKETNIKIVQLFKSYTAKRFFNSLPQNASMDSDISQMGKKLLFALSDKFYRIFLKKAPSLAENMFKETKKSSKKIREASLKQLSGGLTLKSSFSRELQPIAEALISENVSLISSIPEKYFTEIAGVVYRSMIEGGKGINEIRAYLEKYEGITKRRASLIALDQTRKAFSAVNAYSMQENGIEQFQWKHNFGGAHPRESHIRINNEIFSFKNLEAEQATLGVPEKDRGLPGFPPNCRCTMRPVINLNKK